MKRPVAIGDSKGPLMSNTHLTIDRLTARPVVAPLERPVRTASGAVLNAPLVLIDVHMDQGVTGCAYVFGYTPVTLKPIVSFLDNVAELVKGKPAAPVDLMSDLRASFRLLGVQGIAGMALSCLEMALWDALGKACEQPVVRLLGGEPKPIPAYDSYGIVDPVDDRRVLEASVEKGFRAIKIKLGDGTLSRDVQLVAGVRDVIGPDVALMVDYNQSQTVAETVRRIDALQDFDLYWVEEPVHAEDFEGHARIREASVAPIQTGENWWFPADMAKAIVAGACDYAMPDLMKIGGISGWMRAAGLAEAASIPMSSHTIVEPSAHVLPVTPTAHWLEFLDLAGDILVERMEVVDGAVTPRGPGLGIVWDEEAVKRYAA